MPPTPGQGESSRIPRRRFLFQMAGAGAGMMLIADEAVGALRLPRPQAIDNPLSRYPNRGWESVYRDLYRCDSSFTFLCAPNDTHNCLLRAYVKNGVVTRIAPTHGYHRATDLDGNRASQRWDPRCCQKGLALVRRFYGDRRCKRPLVRRGFKQWVDDGFPRDPQNGAVDPKYLDRGRDPWVAVSFDEAFALTAKAIIDIASAYSGEQGTRRLLAQGYDPLMVEATQGAGTQVLKFRGGMPALGATRIFAQYRMANAMALLDTRIRGVGREQALGARGWDNYSWHTDLPPGHPMVTGQQTVDFDLCSVEHAGLAIVWGMNWIATKMPDSHWLTEARMNGTRVVVIAAEYSATANKADEVVIVRPGTTPALALGIAQVLISQRLYDVDYVKANTDLPLLVRMDTGRLLRADEVFAGYQPAALTNNVVLLKDGQKPPPMHQQPGPVVPEAKRLEWGDCVVWDVRSGGPVAVSRDHVGSHFARLAIDPALEGEVTVRLIDGGSVACRPVFCVTRQMLDETYTPENVARITWAPAEAIRALARQIAANQGRTLFVMGMGPNQFFNNDLKDRAVFLVAALTASVGKIGGNVGSYAGNYRTSFFNGLPQYMGEDPFDPEPDPGKPARTAVKWKAESVHYFNHGDSILRMGKVPLTGRTHIPTPTKAIHVSNSNSLIGNAKGHYETIVNTLRRVEFVAVNDWWWTASCEYADVVFPVDSWAEFKYPDMTISVTNPFLCVFPVTPLPRIHDTRSDLEVAAQAPGRLQRRPRRPLRRRAAGAPRRPDRRAAPGERASPQTGRLPVHLPHAQVPPRGAHHARGHRHRGRVVRAVRRHAPQRPPHALRHRDVRDINPPDAKELGIEDGDYVWIDADPHDRPFRGWKDNPQWYRVARLMARARYYPGTPRGVTRMWHNSYGSTWGSVRGAEVNSTGLAKSPETNTDPTHDPPPATRPGRPKIKSPISRLV